MLQNANTISKENPYIVHLDHFEGPMDLLLHLVKINEIDIYDIPVAEITHQYLEYLEIMKDLNINIAAEFLLMASTLIYIKSCELLPPPPGEVTEEIEDLKAEFTRRLIEYQLYKDASQSLEKRDKDTIGIYGKPSLPPSKFFGESGEELLNVTLFDLMTAFKGVLERLSTERTYSLTHQRYFVEDKIKEIIDMLENRNEVRLSDLFGASRNRAEAITYFLAILEMIKEKLIACVQKILFGEILLVKAPQVPD